MALNFCMGISYMEKATAMTSYKKKKKFWLTEGHSVSNGEDEGQRKAWAENDFMHEKHESKRFTISGYWMGTLSPQVL